MAGREQSSGGGSGSPSTPPVRRTGDGLRRRRRRHPARGAAARTHRRPAHSRGNRPMTRNQRMDRSEELASASGREKRRSSVRRSSTRSAESGRGGNAVRRRGPDADRDSTADAESGRTGDVRRAQRVLGNTRLQRLFDGTGPRTVPEVGDPTGRYEREADRIAERVVRGRPATRQSERGHRAEEPSPDGQVESLAVGGASRDGGAGPRLAREPAGERDSRDGPLGPGSPDIGGGDRRAVVRAFAGPGRSLGGSTRSFFESELGYDFGGVRVHIGPQADEAARAVNARASRTGAT